LRSLFFSSVSPRPGAYAGFAFLGAAATAISVYFLGSLGRGGLTPLNLTLVGAALTALFYSLLTSILILSQRTLDEMRFWLAGSLADRDFSLFLQVLPYIIIGLAIAFALGKQITTITLGEDVARSLGQQTVWVKVLAAVSIVLLAGSAVAIAGPIGFIGLIIPTSSVSSSASITVGFCPILLSLGQYYCSSPILERGC
jgi:iron complex transport system permease protein